MRRRVGRMLREAPSSLPVTRIATEPDCAELLAKALGAAAQRDIYWSNEYLYQWLRHAAPAGASGKAPSRRNLFARRALPTRKLSAEGHRFHLVAQDHVSAASKIETLSKLALELKLPGPAVAYARLLAKRGELDAALTVARNNLESTREREKNIAKALADRLSNGAAARDALPSQYELHVIENQIFALERVIAGKNAHRALQRYLGDDDGYLKSRTCHMPFERIDIQENGNCAMCCSQWMPRFSIGNVLTDGVTALDIFKNDRSAAARQSMLDGSFKYCDLVKCPLISGDRLSKKEEAAAIGENTKAAVETGALVYDYPSFVLLAFDQSCNLSCPSCRAHVITEKLDMQTKKESLIGTSIMPLLKKAKILNINPAGEIFVSRPLRRLLSKLNSKDFPDLRLHIISNGTLFNQREWDKFPGIHDMVDTVRISTDGATKATFETMRRGGRWETFLENLQFLAELHRSGVYPQFWLSFTYQIENFREMPAFVDMCKALSPTAIPIFEKIENWGTFDPEDYKRMAVHKMDHPLHDEFLSIIQQPKMQPRMGQLGGDYEGLL